jgi:hypothetical protein
MKNYGQAAEERRFEAAIRAAVSGELSHMIQLTNGDADEIRGMLDAKLDGIPYVRGTNTAGTLKCFGRNIIMSLMLASALNAQTPAQQFDAARQALDAARQAYQSALDIASVKIADLQAQLDTVPKRTDVDVANAKFLGDLDAKCAPQNCRLPIQRALEAGADPLKGVQWNMIYKCCGLNTAETFLVIVPQGEPPLVKSVPLPPALGTPTPIPTPTPKAGMLAFIRGRK